MNKIQRRCEANTRVSPTSDGWNRHKSFGRVLTMMGALMRVKMGSSNKNKTTPLPFAFPSEKIRDVSPEEVPQRRVVEVVALL